MKCLPRVILASFFSLFIFINPVTSYAWNALGHMVIANIAYQRLQPAVRAKVDNLIVYFHQEYNNIDSFTQMASWPDAIRSQKIETFTHWHYIDVPFSNDNTQIKNVTDTDNAVWAITNIEPIVKNANANAFERARFLAFLIHITGDLHQPLHTVSLISAAHPDGDKGGNLYSVRYRNDRTNLHHLWDSGLSTFEGDTSKENIIMLSQAITSHYPESAFGNDINEVNPDKWVKEGTVNAKQYVYNTREDQLVSTDYVTTGKNLSERQAALAGYRLAALLNQLLK